MDKDQSANKFDYVLLIPLIAMFAPAIVSICHGIPLGPALLVGIPIGIVAVIVFTALSGNDMTDLIMSSVLVILFSVALIPVFMQARNRSMAARERAKRTVPAIVQTDTSPRRDR